MEFDTIHWLPNHLAQMREWQEICKAYDHLLSQAAESLSEVYVNQFLDSLTEIGCMIWENFLGISVTESETLEDRRQAIQGYFAGNLPYTENKLRETLEMLAGPENITLKVTGSIYEIKIDIVISTPSVLENVQDIVYKMRPANMVVRICVHYNPPHHLYIGHAVKHTKKLYPTSIEAEDPIEGMIWYVDHDGALLVDETGSAYYGGE